MTCGCSFKKAREEADTDHDPWKEMEWGPVENATKKEFDAAKGEWIDVPVEVKMSVVQADKGSIRECFRCKLRPKDGPVRVSAFPRFVLTLTFHVLRLFGADAHGGLEPRLEEPLREGAIAPLCAQF